VRLVPSKCWYYRNGVNELNRVVVEDGRSAKFEQCEGSRPSTDCHSHVSNSHASNVDEASGCS
jgi:hypothetical protein